MNSPSTERDFRRIISQYPAPVQEMALALRQVIYTILPETVEIPWVRQKTVGYGIGPKKMSEHYCYMVFAKAHINFGFNHGANLKDSNKLLSGAGKFFRNTKIKSLDDVHNPDLADLIRVAIQDRRATRGSK